MVAFSKRVSGLRPSAVNSILTEVREVRAKGRKPVSLMRGQPDFATPPHIVEAAARAMREGRTGYPDNRGEVGLREAVAEKLSRDTGLDYDPGAEILITTGATLGLQVALGALLSDGDEVLLPDPVYDVYRSQIVMAGGRPRPVRASLDAGRFRLDPAALEEAWTPATKVLLLNTPWNPVGTVLSPSELAEIAEFAERRDILLISDEIYEAITYAPHRHVSPAALNPAVRARTILLNSLSKTYAMTGWRVGYCAGPAEIIRAMFLVLQQSSRGPTTFVQDAAAVALTGPQDCVSEMVTEYGRRRELVVKRLEGFPVLVPEGGFFAMLDVRALNASSDEVRRQLLAEHDVVLVHGAAYGEGGEGTLRVSFASGGENLANGLNRLRDGLTGMVRR